MSGFWGVFAGAVSVAVTFGIVEWLARSKAERRLFFIALGRERNAADEARARRVRIVNAVCALIALGGVFLPVGPTLMLALTLGGTTVSMGWLMVESIGALRSAELEDIPSRFAVSLDEPPTVRDYVSVPLQVANVLAILIPAVVFTWLLRQLPASVPMHYDVAGNVDRMGAPSELWALVGIMLFDFVLLWGITWGVAKERWAMPEEGAERYTELSMQRRTAMVRSIEWVFLIVNAAMGLSLVGVAFGGLPGWEWLVGPMVGATAVLSTIGCIVPLVIYVPRMMKAQDEMRQIAGTEVLGTHKSGWRWGGTVYYAPEDPALFVPKRVGIGSTVNFARPAAWVLLIVVVVLPLAISCGAFAL